MGTPSQLEQIAEFVADNPWIPPVVIGVVLAIIIIKCLPGR